MRKYKFRGKAVMTKDELDYQDIPNYKGWVRGSLVTDGDSRYIVGEIVEVNEDGLIHEWWVKVDPKSVGQYTGLKDKNQRDIYEGDIVAVNHHPFNFNGNYEVGYTEIMELSAGSLVLHRVKNYCEVIGKIHENPELLEEGKHE